ncbi:MAG: CPBP family intramembrane metalloprotease [Candidatus Eisenbacteria bacterium]|nr:CPBP family intramembrane metalloprotease [Candidatus Eisenbacteria bacterium]
MPEEMERQTSPEEGRLYGPVSTLAVGLLILALSQIVQIPLLLGALIDMIREGRSPNAENLLLGGAVLERGVIAGAVVGIALTALFTLRRRPYPAAKYLGLLWSGWGRFLAATAIGAVAFIAIEIFRTRLGGEPVPEFLLRAYRSSPTPIVLWFAIAVAAPLFEEILVRGFLLHGLAASRMGWIGAVGITSLLWTLPHIQYGPTDMTTIFLNGIVLGWSRLAAGSIWPAILLHVAVNAAGVAQVAALAG